MKDEKIKNNKETSANISHQQISYATLLLELTSVTKVKKMIFPI